MFELEGKVALVTGAASGIGFAYVKELLRNKLKGVALVDINDNLGQQALNEILQEFGKYCAIFVKADVSDKVQLENAFETTVRTFNQLDIVINNVGIIQERQWEKCIAVNLVGVISGSLLAVEKYLPKYKSGSEGVVINTASAAGLIPMDEGPIYAATKSGVVQFTRAMGGELRYESTKVRVLAICPSYTDTPIANVNEDQLNEPYLSAFTKLISELPSQKPEVLAKNVMNVIREGPTGSAWIAIRDCCTQVEFPKYIDGY